MTPEEHKGRAPHRTDSQLMLLLTAARNERDRIGRELYTPAWAGRHTPERKRQLDEAVALIKHWQQVADIYADEVQRRLPPDFYTVKELNHVS